MSDVREPYLKKVHLNLPMYVTDTVVFVLGVIIRMVITTGKVPAHTIAGTVKTENGSQ